MLSRQDPRDGPCCAGPGEFERSWIPRHRPHSIRRCTRIPVGPPRTLRVCWPDSGITCPTTCWVGSGGAGAVVSLADELSSAPKTPPARRSRPAPPPRTERDSAGNPAEVKVSLPTIPEDEQAFRDEIKRVTRLDVPEDRRVLLTQVRYWGEPGSEQVYCRFTIEDHPATGDQLDIEDLIKVAKKATPPRKRVSTERALVVAWADLQVGKVGSRGGTEELITRVMEKLAALEKHTKRVKADSVYLIDAGDCVESFENTPEQGFTNDLSFPEQIRLA